MEEYISSLVTYVSFKKDEPHAAISSIPLEKLTKLTDKKDAVAIDPPEAPEYESENIDHDAIGYAAGKKVNEQTNERDLYKNFEHMMKSGTINFVTTTTKKQHQP